LALLQPLERAATARPRRESQVDKVLLVVVIGAKRTSFTTSVKGGLGPFAIMVQRGSDIFYINATSTRECTFRAGFAAECGRMSANTGSENL
jgi:hypothetical protein